MSAMKADEKQCPYCAETIKSAAIKCRYCQSDLSTPPPRQAVAPPPRQPSSVLAAGIEEPPLDDEPGPSPRASLRDGLGGPVATAVLALAAVVLAVACVWVVHVRGDDGTAAGGRVVSDDARAVALSEATDLTEKTLSYNYKDFDTIRKSNAARMSPSFQKQYSATMDKVADRTKKFKVVLDAKVVAGGIVTVTAHRADVLVFVNQTTQALARPDQKPTADLNRVLVTMVRSDGDWRIDKLDPLAGA